MDNNATKYRAPSIFEFDCNLATARTLWILPKTTPRNPTSSSFHLLKPVTHHCLFRLLISKVIKSQRGRRGFQYRRWSRRRWRWQQTNDEDDTRANCRSWLGSSARLSDWTRDWRPNRAPDLSRLLRRGLTSVKSESVSHEKPPEQDGHDAMTDTRHRRLYPRGVNNVCFLLYYSSLPQYAFHNLSLTQWSLLVLSLLPVRLAYRPTMFPSQRFLDETCWQPRLVLPPCSWEIERLWLTMMSSLQCILVLGYVRIVLWL